MSMQKYSENYLNVSTKVYAPATKYRKYIRGAYMFTEEYKQQLLRDLGDSGYVLFDFYYTKSGHNYFKPNDNQYIADRLHWSVAKVKRIRKELKDKGYLLVLSDTGKDGTKFYRILMGQDIVTHYLKTGNLLVSDDLDVPSTNTIN